MDPASLTVRPAEHGMALLAFLAQRLSLSRRRAKTLLDERRVFVCDRRIWMAHHALRRGDTVDVTAATTAARTVTPLPCLYEDDTLLAIDKPAGRIVIGEHGLETQARRQIDCRALRAVHRLDRDTTGCLLFAKQPAVLPALITAFRERTVCKTYDALVAGRVPFAQRSLRMPIDGAPAVTHVRRLQAGSLFSHLELRIETGRTHQIRRHLAAIGFPVAGDKQYGAHRTISVENKAIARQMLHARRITLTHPVNHQALDIIAALPDDFIEALKRGRLTAPPS